MNIQKIFIVGAGTMGSGIAQIAAVAGYQVIMMDVVPDQIEKGQQRCLSYCSEKERAFDIRRMENRT